MSTHTFQCLLSLLLCCCAVVVTFAVVFGLGIALRGIVRFVAHIIEWVLFGSARPAKRTKQRVRLSYELIDCGRSKGWVWVREDKQ